MQVLGLDPSLTNFGWAIHDTNAEGAARCPNRGRFQTSAKTLFIARYVDLRERLRALLREENPDRVSCEYPVFNDLWSEGMYGLFLYTNEALWKEGFDVVYFSPGQLKAHAAAYLNRPKGWKMLKGDMVEAARAHCGETGRWNHNEADAYWASSVGGRFWQLYEGEISEDDLTPLERKQFLRIHTFQRGKRKGKTVKTGIMYRENERFYRWSDMEDS